MKTEGSIEILKHTDTVDISGAVRTRENKSARCKINKIKYISLS